MRRVMVIGGPGSGKTTFAHELGRLSGLPVISLDAIYWQAGWTQRPVREADNLARRAAEGNAWIIEGNYAATFPERLQRADTLVFLDLGTVRRLFRVVARTVRHFGRVRPHMAAGCPERFSWGFLKWVAHYSRRGRLRTLAMIAGLPPGIRIVHLGTPRQVRRFLAGREGAMPEPRESGAGTGPEFQ